MAAFETAFFSYGLIGPPVHTRHMGEEKPIAIPDGLYREVRDNRPWVVNPASVRQFASYIGRTGITAADVLPSDIWGLLEIPIGLALGSDAKYSVPRGPCYAEQMESLGNVWMTASLTAKYRLDGRLEGRMIRHIPDGYAGWASSERAPIRPPSHIKPLFWDTPKAEPNTPVVLTHGELSAAALASIPHFPLRVASLPGATSFNPPLPPSDIAYMHEHADYRSLVKTIVVVWLDTD